MAEFFSTQNLIALLTLTGLEIVLGIDNVIFIAVLAGKLPVEQRARARTVGIGLAVITRILLLLSITWVMRLTEPLFTILEHGFTGRDLILLGGGAFLIAKSTFEIHDKLESSEHTAPRRAADTFASVIIQIVLIDIIFSLDSVITAVGLSGVLSTMIVAVLIAAGVMLAFSGPISNFVEKHPTMKVLALSFLILIGTLLVIEGWNSDIVHEYHLRNYAYFAMAFSFLVELVNMRLRPSPAPVVLHNSPTMPQPSGQSPSAH